MDFYKEDKAALKSILSLFSCRDDDINRFLYEKSIEFERIGKSRTYLIFSENDFQNHRAVVLGYFSLALKTLILPENIPKKRRKTIDGYSATIHRKPVREIPCYLIGQIARNSSVSKDIISGEELMNKALETIMPATDIVGGRWVLVECHNKKELCRFYTDNGFEYIMDQPNEDERMVQMILKIKDVDS